MQKTPLTAETIAPAPDLGGAFVASVQRGLSTALGPGAEIDTQVTISASRRAHVAVAALVWPFWIVARFRGRHLVGQIAFGDRELWLRAAVRPESLTDPDEGYAFWEWAAALGQSPVNLKSTEWCIQPARVEEVTAVNTEWLGHYASILVEQSASLVPIMRSAREERARAVRASEQARAVDIAAAAARAAFRRGDHAGVVAMLGPHEGALPPAVAKLLSLARRAVSA